MPVIWLPYLYLYPLISCGYLTSFCRHSKRTSPAATRSDEEQCLYLVCAWLLSLALLRFSLLYFVSQKSYFSPPNNTVLALLPTVLCNPPHSGPYIFLCQIGFNSVKYATVTRDPNVYQVRVLFLSNSKHVFWAFEIRKCYKSQNITFFIVMCEMLQ